MTDEITQMQEVTVSDGIPTVQARESAQVDQQIATAHRYPRSISGFLRDVEALACHDERTAEECFYVLPRGGKRIEGPSIRLAEIVAACWGNLRWSSSIVDIGDTMLTASGYAWDLERNIAVQVEVQRRITDRHGRRYSDDMIAVTANAASSVAMRNAILRVIPFALVRQIYERAKAVSLGQGKTHEQRIEAAIDAWAQLGQDEATVLRALDRRGREDLSVDDLIALRGMWTAVRDGEISADEAMRPKEDDGRKLSKVELPTRKGGES